MPIRINEMTSDIKAGSGNAGLTPADLAKIVKIVLEKVQEEQAHQNRIAEETKIRDQASEVEPY